jgi:3-hydroxyisobutyrate dehydrogenase-like beta-hydroxyacid dehydrogenase
LKNSSPLPITGQILGYYEELEQAGDGELDTSSLIRRLR